MGSSFNGCGYQMRSMLLRPNRPVAKDSKLFLALCVSVNLNCAHIFINTEIKRSKRLAPCTFRSCTDRAALQEIDVEFVRLNETFHRNPQRRVYYVHRPSTERRVSNVRNVQCHQNTLWPHRHCVVEQCDRAILLGRCEFAELFCDLDFGCHVELWTRFDVHDNLCGIR